MSYVMRWEDEDGKLWVSEPYSTLEGISLAAQIAGFLISKPIDILEVNNES